MHLRYTIILYIAITINYNYKILTYRFVTAIVKIATQCKRTLVYLQTQAETFSRSEVRGCTKHGMEMLNEGSRRRHPRCVQASTVPPLTFTPGDVIESRYGPSRRKTRIKYVAYVASSSRSLLPLPFPLRGDSARVCNVRVAESCVWYSGNSKYTRIPMDTCTVSPLANMCISGSLKTNPWGIVDRGFSQIGCYRDLSYGLMEPTEICKR